LLRLFPFCLNHAFGLRRRSCRRRRSRDGLPVPRTKSYVFNYSFDLLSGVLELPLRKDRLNGVEKYFEARSVGYLLWGSKYEFLLAPAKF
jgi:hypothetical protein